MLDARHDMPDSEIFETPNGMRVKKTLKSFLSQFA